MIPVFENEIQKTGLYPEYSEDAVLSVMLGTLCYNTQQTFTTQSLSPTVIASGQSASSISFKGVYNEGDAVIGEVQFLTFNGEDINGNEATVTGLDPNTEYTVSFTVEVNYGDDCEYTKSYTGFSTLSTEPMVFTTMEAKKISEDDVIVGSISNLNDLETTAGFEWRVAGGDEDLFDSKYGLAYIYEGMMEGIIHKLNVNYLWKFRPYYQSNNGNYYYGDWLGIDLSDNQSYFEPTVHTYANIEVEDGTATVSGYAQRGSDEIDEEGFEYWEDEDDASNAPLRAPSHVVVPDNANRVLADGTLMQVQLTGLRPNSTYKYVAFVRTVRGDTFYGVARKFTTGDFQLATAIESDISKHPMKDETIYDVLGRKQNKLRKGVNVIRMSNGKARKVYVK